MEITSISLRDWFAGQALIAYGANGGCLLEVADVAEIAYKIADAMLMVREREDR